VALIDTAVNGEGLVHQVKAAHHPEHHHQVLGHAPLAWLALSPSFFLRVSSTFFPHLSIFFFRFMSIFYQVSSISPISSLKVLSMSSLVYS
jgi:hypothetical protein